MAKYKKRADGRYATSIKIGYKDDGKPKLKTLYGRTIRELDNKVAEFKALQNKGIIVDDKNLTLSEWSKRWLELYKSGMEYKTYEMYEQAIKRNIDPEIGNIRLNMLKRHMLQELLNKYIDGGHCRTAEIIRMTLNQIIKAAIKEQYIYVNVADGLTLPPHKAAEKRSLTDDELKRIQTSNLSLKERAFIGVLTYAGLRRGEALALTPADIDLKNGIIHVNKAVYFEKNIPHIKDTPKNNSSIREIPIPNKLKKDLKAHLSSNIGAPYVFTMQTKNELMTVSAFRRMWQNIKDKAALPADVTPHICRHTFTTQCIKSGMDIKTVQRLLGHSSIRMTMEVYNHFHEDSESIQKQLDTAFNL